MRSSSLRVLTADIEVEYENLQYVRICDQCALQKQQDT